MYVEVGLAKVLKMFDVHVKQMRYHQDEKDEYYYQENFYRIYEDRFFVYEGAPYIYISWKATPPSDVASFDSLIPAVKAYFDNFIDRIMVDS